MHRLSQSLILKFCVIVLVLSVLETLVAYAAIQRTRTDTLANYYTSRLALMEQAGMLDQCDAAPSAWSPPDQGHGRTFPIVAHGHMPHAEAPNVDLSDALASARPDAPAQVNDDALPYAMVYVVARPGPCKTFLMLPPDAAITMRSPILRLMPLRLMAGLVLLAAVGLAIGLPLSRRVQRLSQDAQRITGDRFEGELQSDALEFAPLVAAFNAATAEARRQLEEESKRQEILYQLFEAISHDIRTPLASMKLASGKLMRGGDVSEIGRSLRFEIDYLDAMFTNTATVARMRSTAMPLQLRSLDLAPIVERVAARFGVQAHDKGAELNVALPDTPVVAHADPLAIEQALSNLVHNAVKHAQDHVAIVLHSDNGAAHMRVLNDGEGVPPDEIPKLTEWRYRSTSTTKPGSGMGLAITQAIVERHDGTLTIEPYEEGGIVAEICIPLERASCPA